MKTDGVIQRFYIPMRKESPITFGVYDLVNDTFVPSASNTAFTANARMMIDDGTTSPYYSIPVVVPTPSTKTGSIADQIDRINENIANAYDVCRQIGRTMPPIENSFYLEPTILEQRFQTFTVTFENYDGTVLQTGQYYCGQTPVYSGSTPIKPSDTIYDYTFSGWGNLMPVTGSITYTAQYTSSLRNYTVNWKNWDNSVIETEYYHYGDLPIYKGTTPTRPYDGYTYTFDSWSPAVTAITQNQNYIAQYTHSAPIPSTKMYYKKVENGKTVNGGYPAYNVYLRDSRADGYSEVVNFSNFNGRYWGSDTTNIYFVTPIIPPINDIQWWFNACPNLTSISNIHYVKTDYVDTLSSIFTGTKLKTIDISSWNTDNVVHKTNGEVVLNHMLRGCGSLTYLDLSNMDFTRFANTAYSDGLTTSMIEGCRNVQTAYCKTAADKAILDQLLSDLSYSWRFTVKQ